MVEVASTATVAVTGNCKGDAKATASVAGKVTAAEIGDGSSKGDGNRNSKRW